MASATATKDRIDYECVQIEVPRSHNVTATIYLAETPKGVWARCETMSPEYGPTPLTEDSGPYAGRNEALAEMADELLIYWRPKTIEQHTRSQASVKRAVATVKAVEKFRRKFDHQVPRNGAGNGRPTQPEKRSRPRADKPVEKAVDETAGGKHLIPIDAIEPHPHNPRKQFIEQELKGLADSLKEHGLLQDIVVRPHPDPRGKIHFQLVAGERRWRAAKLAGWTRIGASVRELDDRQALEVIGVENAKREDLNDIEVAEYLAHVCQPEEEGGGGLTRKAAAAIFGKSEAWAANLIRLLELPDVWRDRVAAGELEQTKARCLLPYAKAKRVMAEFDKSYTSKNNWERQEWEGPREQLEEHLAQTAEAETRSTSETYYGYEYGSHACYLDLEDPQLREQLELVEIRTYDGVELRAQNVKLFDKLQQAEIQKRRKQKKKGKDAGKAGPTRTISPQEKAQQQKRRLTRTISPQEKAQQQKRRLEEWRLLWIRSLLAERLNPDDWQVEKATLWLVTIGRRDGVARAVASLGGRRLAGTWGTLGTLPAGTWFDVAAAALRDLLWPKDRAPELVARDVVEGLALDYELDLEREWLQSQSDDKPDRQQHVKRFFELHSKDQLEALAKQYDVSIVRAKTKGAIVKALLGQAGRGRKLLLPKSVRRVKPKRKSPRKKARRKKVSREKSK